MKLYTEEQVRRAMDFARGHHRMSDTQFIGRLIPIEPPSDNNIKHEAITQMGQWYGSGCEDEIFAFINGAKYVINKIQGGNQ